MNFREFDAAAFLRDYWQKKPLLLRNIWDDWANPLEPDELAGLACEGGVESRLIVKAGDDWRVEHGPVDEGRFGQLGGEPWTLLVQAVDQHVAEVAALIEPFRFVPDWRIDDVMVSYATDGGGVGAHFDQYDVFLIQGLGQRRWQIGRHCTEDSALLPHEDLRLLADFEPNEEWVLGPGDMLYVPPGVAHNGIAVGDDCMTYSIGFRAPSRAELIGNWIDDVLADGSDDDRYADPGLSLQANPGEITARAIAALHAMAIEKLSDPAAFARWFGEYNSAPKYPEIDWRPEQAVTEAQVREALANKTRLIRNPASRFSFIRERAGLLLFVNGASFECHDDEAVFAERLCAERDGIEGASDASTLIAQLINQGSLALNDG